MRTFENFPQDALCPLCGTNDNKECTLVTIDDTQDGNVSQAHPVHTDCIKTAPIRYNPKAGILYMWAVTEEL